MQPIVLNTYDAIAIAALVVIGVWELCYILTNHSTMSQMYQKLFPVWVDMILGFGGLVLLIFAWFLHPAIRLIIVFFWGHITIPNKETYQNQKG